MSRTEVTARLDDVAGAVEIDDESIITVQDDIQGGRLRVMAPEHDPLTGLEPHAHLSLKGNKSSIDIVLNAEQVDALVDALEGDDA